MKWLAILLAVFVTGAFASEVIFYDDFKTNPFKENNPRWEQQKPEFPYTYPYWQWNEAKHFISTGVSTSKISIWTTDDYKYEFKGGKYKMKVRYKFSSDIGPMSSICLRIFWGDTNFLIDNIVTNWRVEEEIFYTGSRNSSIGMKFFTRNTGSVYVDYVEIKECFVGVEPVSIGKIKSLYR